MALSDFARRITPRLYLRLTCILLSVAILVMLVTLLPVTHNNSDYYADGLGSTFVSMPIAGNCWSIIYCTIILGLNVFGNIQQHPGIDVAMDFFGWALNWCFGIMLLWWTADGVDNEVEFACDNIYNSYSGFDEGACALAKKMVGLHYTSGLLAVIVGYADDLEEES